MFEGGATQCAMELLDALERLEELEGVPPLLEALPPELLHTIRAQIDEVSSVEELHRLVSVLREQIEGATAEIATRAKRTGGVIATTSLSGTVLQALLASENISVILSESRPKYEGRRLAQVLSEAGVPVTLCTEAALLSQLPRVDEVWVGADAVGSDFFANKVGTLALCLGAKHHEVPVRLLVDQLKWLASDDYSCELSRPAEEVWPNAPEGVEIINPYFEKIPLDLIAEVIQQ
jgi:translation initiation factor 2B subunit (eIF-2B alpha/beta/delta family)